MQPFGKSFFFFFGGGGGGLAIDSLLWLQRIVKKNGLAVLGLNDFYLITNYVIIVQKPEILVSMFTEWKTTNRAVIFSCAIYTDSSRFLNVLNSPSL